VTSGDTCKLRLATAAWQCMHFAGDEIALPASWQSMHASLPWTWASGPGAAIAVELATIKHPMIASLTRRG
jgi:hypothetical protein